MKALEMRMWAAVQGTLQVIGEHAAGISQPDYGKVCGAMVYLAMAVYNGMAMRSNLGRLPTKEELVQFTMNTELFNTAAEYAVDVVLPKLVASMEKKT